MSITLLTLCSHKNISEPSANSFSTLPLQGYICHQVQANEQTLFRSSFAPCQIWQVGRILKCWGFCLFAWNYSACIYAVSQKSSISRFPSPHQMGVWMMTRRLFLNNLWEKVFLFLSRGFCTKITARERFSFKSSGLA